MSRENWIREDGLEEDKLFKTHKNLRYKWQWSDIMHTPNSSQVSFAKIGRWKLEAVHWHSEYEADVSYQGGFVSDRPIISKKGIRIRLDAQIAAEELLISWLKEEYSKIAKR